MTEEVINDQGDADVALHHGRLHLPLRTPSGAFWTPLPQGSRTSVWLTLRPHRYDPRLLSGFACGVTAGQGWSRLE